MAGNKANNALFEPWGNVRGYLARMQGFGHGSFTEIAADNALAIGTEAEPQLTDATVDARVASDIVAGTNVTVTPNDYGRIPVAGQLMRWNTNEVVIKRVDKRAGNIMVHFPSIGFEVTAVE